MQKKSYSDAQEALDKAKVHLMTKPGSRFMSSLSVQLDHKLSDAVPTAGTNGKEILYNPNFFIKLTKEERIGLIFHECAHIAFLHNCRCGDRNKTIYNVAADYVINCLLIKNNFKLPPDGYYDPKYDGWSTEQVYDDLVQNNFEPPPDFQSDLLESDSKPTEELEQEVTNTVLCAVQRARMEGGDIPKEIDIAIDQLINPKLSWKEILYRFIDEKNKEDYSWARPNKKYMPSFYLPSRYSDTLNNLTIAIDTSGSMTNEFLVEILTEIQYINETLKPQNLTVLDCDSRIHNIHHVTDSSSILEYEFTGGGGTNGTPVINHGNDNDTNLLIYFTDGYMSLNLPQPNFAMLWVISGNIDFKAPFGDIVFVT